MADHHRHHHHHRPQRISVPPRSTSTSNTTASYNYPPTTPTPTPSKHRLSTLSAPFKPASSSSSLSSKSSLPFLLVLLFSLRSLYSLLPFLRSSPSFSLFPFSFLVSLLSFLLSLTFSLLPKSSSSRQDRIFSLSSISHSQHKLLLWKSALLAVVFLLRFQALRYCGTSAMILAELGGNVAARFVTSPRGAGDGNKISGFLMLFIGLLLLSLSWDRIDCFPFSTSFVGKYGFSMIPRENCVRFWPMLLPFLCGFLGCYERVSMNVGTIRQLGRKWIRLGSLFYTTVLLFIPAVVSFVVYEGGEGGVSFGNLGWPLANTVVFGVLLSENYSDEKLGSSKDFQREFLVTFVCTIVLELFYFPELSLWGLLLCGLLLYVAVRELDPMYSKYLELGLGSSETFSSSIMKPIRHILSERKSRKIALFLLINAAYMVVEFVVGFMSNSLGLVSDACHMLFDCAALAIGLYASYISRLPANYQFNYGRGRFEILSGYVNAVFLVLVGALIVLESIERILDPQEISTNSLLVVSIGGLVVNLVGLVFFHEEHHHAHGGSCSHSHSHPHSHSHDHHHQHGHEDHEKHHECISISHGCDDNTLMRSHHEHDHCNQEGGGAGVCKIGSSSCHDQHDHAHNPEHQNPCENHNRHHHSQHDHDHNSHHDHDHHSHHDHPHENHNHHHHSQHDHDHHSRHDHDHHSHHDHHHENHGEHCQHHHTDHVAHGSVGHGDSHHSVTNVDSSLGNSQHGKPVSHEKKQQKSHHHHIDHNMEGIFLHVLADTMGSVGVVISTLLIKYKGWLVADPASSIFISVLIISSVIPLLRNSAEILLQRVPRAHEQDLKEAVNDVIKIKGVHGIRNLHVWSFTNTDIVGTLHLHVSAETDKASLRKRISQIFHGAGIKDLTVQMECIK